MGCSFLQLQHEVNSSLSCLETEMVRFACRIVFPLHRWLNSCEQLTQDAGVVCWGSVGGIWFGVLEFRLQYMLNSWSLRHLATRWWWCMLKKRTGFWTCIIWPTNLLDNLQWKSSLGKWLENFSVVIGFIWFAYIIWDQSASSWCWWLLGRYILSEASTAGQQPASVLALSASEWFMWETGPKSQEVTPCSRVQILSKLQTTQKVVLP